MIFISAHADTNYKNVSLRIDGDDYVGLLDNYVGVFAAMKAFFSGEIDFVYVRMELTPDEEIDMRGAQEVAKEVSREDLVIVIDVTGTPTEKDFVIEKCRSERVRNFLKETLKEFSYDIYEDCPDPVANMDETDVYKHRTKYYFFLGLPCRGGDYNFSDTRCRIRSVDEVSKALIEICKNYKKFCSSPAEV
ncbi:MAG TPA: M28 family peptidase [Ignavibacteria bacterium]|nr:hypothetical protein [Bacteroidota bacterium]HRI85619.1 M28 family peptidase [Ignavibacteria bacterium]HRJ99156.1 M28 family peptidase [Ignavibacteria bacterium]